MQVESSVQKVEGGWRWTVVAGDRRLEGVEATQQEAKQNANAFRLIAQSAHNLRVISGV